MAAGWRRPTLSGTWTKHETDRQALNVELQERQRGLRVDVGRIQGGETAETTNPNTLTSLHRLAGKLSDRTEVWGLQNTLLPFFMPLAYSVS